MTNKAMSVQKLQNSTENITTQFRLEKASSKAKDNIIKSLEDMVIDIVYNSNDIQEAEKLIEKKNEDIVALKKQLKLPPSEHPHTKDVLENQSQKDEMMDFILQLNAQLKEMENEMDKLVQEKKANMEAVIVTTIPIVTTEVPSTLEASVATTVPVATTLPTTSATTLVTESSIVAVHLSDEASKLIKAMQDMSIQTKEINRLKDQIKSLEDENMLVKIMHKYEIHKSKRSTERIQKIEKELVLKEPLAEEKHQL